MVTMSINEWGLYHTLKEMAEERAAQEDTERVAFQNLATMLKYILDRSEVPQPGRNPYWDKVEAEHQRTGKWKMVKKGS